MVSSFCWFSIKQYIHEFIPNAREEDIGDPVTQAFVLTAIVIALAFTLYLLAGMAAQTRRGGVPELAPPPEGDGARTADEILAELEGREADS